MNFRESLHQWAALRRGVVKPSTAKYHLELISLILRDWPGDRDAVADTISTDDLLAFTERIGHLSASRWNGIVTLLRVTVPAARNLKRRTLRLKDRPMLNQLQFARLLEECDKLPQSRACGSMKPGRYVGATCKTATFSFPGASPKTDARG